MRVAMFLGDRDIDELLDRGRALPSCCLRDGKCAATLSKCCIASDMRPRLAIQLGELQDHVDESGVELEDLLVDRDGF